MNKITYKKIGIIGYGFLGKAVQKYFANHYETFIFDPYIEGFQESKAIQNCDVNIICTPTPSDSFGKCDIAAVESTINLCNANLIIIKSTVTPGTTDSLIKKTGKNIVFAPEFIGESTYKLPENLSSNMIDFDYFIFGGDPKHTSKAVDLYMPISGPYKKYYQTSAIMAEMTKYLSTSFAATKICFAYEIANLCKNINIDYNALRELWTLDPRVGPMYTAVFAENKNPYGGKCLPKDVSAFINYAEEAGAPLEILKQVQKSNQNYNEKN